MMSATVFVLGETRVDAYIALNVLTYYICYAIMRPSIGRKLTIRIYNVLLLLIMGLIIFLRIYEVIVS